MKPKNLAWVCELWTCADPCLACVTCPRKRLAIFLRPARGRVTSHLALASLAQDGWVENSTPPSSCLHRCSEPRRWSLRLRVVPYHVPVGDKERKISPHASPLCPAVPLTQSLIFNTQRLGVQSPSIYSGWTHLTQQVGLHLLNGVNIQWPLGALCLQDTLTVECDSEA